MIIGYDGKRAMRNLTGLGNYSRMVLDAVAREYPETDIRVYAPRGTMCNRMIPLLQHHNLKLCEPTCNVPSVLWRTFGITGQLKQDNIELYHGLSNELPWNIRNTEVRSVVTMHDVIYRRLPYCYKPIDRKIYDLKYGHSCRVADHIIAVSECTKQDVMHFYNVPEEKITVIYQGCSDIFREEKKAGEEDRLRQSYPSLPKRFMLQVGTIEKRKNAELSVRALQGLPEDLGLVLVGRGKEYLQYVLKLAAELRVAERVTVLQNVPTEDIATLNRTASVVVYPSRYEGFGIPILEALCSRTPVVAATGSCLEEAGGPGSYYVSPDDARGLAEAIRALTDGTADIQDIVARGLRHAARFSNYTVARDTMSIYEKILGCR